MLKSTERNFRSHVVKHVVYLPICLPLPPKILSLLINKMIKARLNKKMIIFFKNFMTTLDFIIWTSILIFVVLNVSIDAFFLSLKVFGLLPSSLLLFSHFGRYVLQPSSGVCRTRKPTWNFELHPLLNPVMVNRIRTDDPHGFNKGHSSKFCVGSWVQQTPEEGWRTYRSKCCGNNNKDEDNKPNTLNDKNHQASSQKFRQLRCFLSWIHSTVTS